VVIDRIVVEGGADELAIAAVDSAEVTQYPSFDLAFCNDLFDLTI
jgi:hypothetical protein